ncbi:hypothetical protein CS0771_48050 [Catellatospora sp. IY07-71]|uniref:DUF4145 domain-containing protein n=1 Tax=Catellatospora sp. IY07-71 TaxID=2728827 RepID=UPI001BB35045|nr:DUF4145 domain-containing protein [Catellatospora sp. IY07-71]BCJ75261.1 hypothetical protein CS0771_48050 [Catellatospora sp. IY07-71]
MIDPLDQLTAASRNFAFLGPVAPRMGADAAAAEYYAFSDPDAAMGRARRFAEEFTRSLSGPFTGKEPSLHERVRRLVAGGVVPGRLVPLLDTVRRHGNEAVHQGSGDVAKALVSVEHCFRLAVWWHEHTQGSPPGHAYVPPSAALGRSLELRRLVEAFEKAVDAPPPRIVIAPRAAPAEDWAGGVEVTGGPHRYVVYGPAEVSEAPDRSWVFRDAAARRHDASNEPVRLRGVRGAGAAYEQLVRGLDRQSALLAELGGRPGLPRPVWRGADGDAELLVAAPPAGVSWQERFGLGPQPLDPLVVPMALSAAIDLANTLTALHQAGATHLALSGRSVLVGRDRRGALRDLGHAGLAALPPAADGYPAPEQRASAYGRPGPASDVYQVAALLHHTCAGAAPGGGPVVLSPHAPAGLAELLAAALDPEPRRRPDLRTFAGRLRRVRTHPHPEATL